MSHQMRFYTILERVSYNILFVMHLFVTAIQSFFSFHARITYHLSSALTPLGRGVSLIL
jgi:hypothetical protein